MASEAFDDSPPRNGTIFFYALLTVFLLVCVKFLLDSYFTKMMDTEVHDKILTQGIDDVAAMRAAEREHRDDVKTAMGSLAQRGRGAMPQIKPANMVAPPEQGWRELQHAPAQQPAKPEAGHHEATPENPAEGA